MKKILLFLLFLGLSFNAKSSHLILGEITKVPVLPEPIDNAPDIRCVSVLLDGSVEIVWDHLPSSSGTVYSIFHSSNINGQFILLDSVSSNINTYNHLVSSVNFQQQYYYITSHSSCGNVSYYSDTLSSINLNVASVNNSTAADLNWNPINVPLPTTSFTEYNIHTKDANGAYQIVGQSPTTDFFFPAQTCDSYQSFYVSLEDQSGCFSYSTVDSAMLNDIIGPALPAITHVSVDDSGKAIINWTCVATDVDSFEIYKRTNQGWITIGVVPATVTTFLYNSSNASNVHETFSVRALDSCNNASTRSKEHNSINLEAKINICDFTIELNWNEYINIIDGLSHYNLFINEIDQSGGINNSIERISYEQMTFTINNINIGSVYYIFVEACNMDTSLVATSDKLQVSIEKPIKPSFNYIQSVSINHDNGFVELDCLIDNQPTIDHYDVFRSFKDEDNFNKIGCIPFNGSANVHYLDRTAITSNQSYKYQVYPVDSCGVRLTVPPVSSIEYINDTSLAQTILLQVEINRDDTSNLSLKREYTNTITFNEYQIWLGSVSEYRLYRSVNRKSFSVLPLYVWDRFSNPEEELLYIDVVTEYGDGNGSFCYYVEAIEGNFTPYEPALYGASSNVECVSQTPIIFIPSVFTPNDDEHNEVFRPITCYVSDIGYSFIIYNREGILMFSTNDPQKGWDGTYQGSQVQDGSYVYYLQYINGVGDLTEKTDIITIVR